MDLKIRRDLLLSFGSQLGYKILGFVVLALLARHLSIEAFGQFMWATALAGLAVLFTELGTGSLLTREVAREPGRAGAGFVEILRLRIPLLGLHVLLVAGFAGLTRPDLLPLAVLTALWVALKDVHRTAAAVLLGLRRVGATVISYGGGMLLLTAGVSVVVTTAGGLDGVLVAYLVWGGALALASLALVRFAIGRPLPWRLRGRGWRVLVRAALPLFALDLLSMVHLKGDTVLLGLLAPDAEVAAYEAGARLLEASHFLVRPLTLIFFPIASAYVHEASWDRFGRLLSRLLVVGLGLGIATAVGMALLAPHVVQVVYGVGFDASVPVVRLLFASVPGLYVSVVAVFCSNAMDRERGLLPVLAAGVSLNLALNVMLIPSRGSEGAALATIASQTLMAAALVVGALRGLARLRAERSVASAGAGRW